MTLSQAGLVDFAVALHRRHSEELGFIPRSRMADYAASGQLLLASEGGDAAGYLILGRSNGTGRIFQACIEPELRLLGIGRELVERSESMARQDGATALRLRCRDGLAALAFWSALGFEKVATVPGGLKRKRSINVLERPVSESIQVHMDFTQTQAIL